MRGPAAVRPSLPVRVEVEPQHDVVGVNEAPVVVLQEAGGLRDDGAARPPRPEHLRRGNRGRFRPGRTGPLQPGVMRLPDNQNQQARGESPKPLPKVRQV